MPIVSLAIMVEPLIRTEHLLVAQLQNTVEVSQVFLGRLCSFLVPELDGQLEVLVGEVTCLSVVTESRVAVAKTPVGTGLTNPVYLQWRGREGGISRVIIM
jgi:hypothetical protein